MIPALRLVWRGAPSLMLLAILSACDSGISRTPAPSEAPERIVSLAPHLTEIAFAAGAGAKLVGVVAYSDYPEPARALPVIGDAFRVDYELLARLEPDLLLAWQGGNPPALLDRLRALGYRVEAFEPRRIDDIPAHMEAIGQLAGSPATARSAAAAFRSELATLREGYGGRTELSVFYQVAREPLFTVSDRHVIGQAISLCGGRNVFGDMPELTPVVALESVLDSRPEVILIGISDGALPADGAGWNRWTTLPAVSSGQVHALPADRLSRSGPRLIDGVRAICEVLEQARSAASPAVSATGVR